MNSHSDTAQTLINILICVFYMTLIIGTIISVYMFITWLFGSSTAIVANSSAIDEIVKYQEIVSEVQNTKMELYKRQLEVQTSLEEAHTNVTVDIVASLAAEQVELAGKIQNIQELQVRMNDIYLKIEGDGITSREEFIFAINELQTKHSELSSVVKRVAEAALTSSEEIGQHGESIEILTTFMDNTLANYGLDDLLSSQESMQRRIRDLERIVRDICQHIVDTTDKV